MTERYVLATAGHVDHGKSTLVRALTGRDPDRLPEEKARGLTVDLGFAWTTLPSGAELAFVDVPGHQRFIGTMLAGLGPTPAVLLVVAADQGWQAQTAEHVMAVQAMGVRHGLVVVTRADLADPGPTVERARAELAGTGLATAEVRVVSARTGAGLAQLRSALDGLVGSLPRPRTDGRVRLWLDRAFTITGAGTVVTGTLSAGSVRSGDTLDLAGAAVQVRGVQSCDRPVPSVGPTSRVALNLRGAPAGSAGRGQPLTTPDAWWWTRVLDARVTPADTRLPQELALHAGTAAQPAHVRSLGRDHVRVSLRRAAPLEPGDRLLLRDPGTRRLWGLRVLDVDPPALRRRGDARRRAEALDQRAGPDLAAEVHRRGAVPLRHLELLGVPVGPLPPDVTSVPGWLLADETARRWAEALRATLAEHLAADPVSGGLPEAAVVNRLGLPRELLGHVVALAGLVSREGTVAPPATNDLGPAERGVAELERRLCRAPFAAPDRNDLTALGLGSRELAAGARMGRLLRLPDDIVLLPDAPDRATAALAALDQPFTTSAARQRLETTRRVAIPLLEHLDARGVTEQTEPGKRRIVTRG